MTMENPENIMLLNSKNESTENETICDLQRISISRLLMN